MTELSIQKLHVQIENVAGHEHRVQPITVHAAAIFAERLSERWADGGRAPDSESMDNLSAPPVSLNLNAMSDEQAASAIANAWLEVLALRLKL
jgi:hypothetical protein